ncbi:MAG: trypsin-like serine protease [Saprospiraceae bacterium]|nr:trypsin-like serine protease [Candidatus Opimibacter skivensis]
MKTNFITLSIIWIFTICASAQTQKPERHTPFQPQTEEKRYLPPVPFPKPNMNPDPSIFNEQALISKGGITTELLLDTSLILPESIIVKGNPGNARPVTFPFDDISSRAFSSMMVAQDITEYPLSTAVRLYISWPSGGGQCSGILIDAKHVLTAGHCVYDIDNDEWATSMEVSPAYDDGPNEFFGTSDIGAKISWSGWVENDNFEHDLAVVELTRPVGSLAGWCGFGYNNSNAYFTGNTFHNYSYPGESPYDGETMYYRNGNYDAPQLLFFITITTVGVVKVEVERLMEIK